MPQGPYLVSGKVYTSRGTVLNSVVRVNHQTSVKTDSEGKYLLDLANMDDGYTSGSSYTIESWDEFDNEYKSDTITVTGGGQTKNLFLDLRNKTNAQTSPTINNQVELRTAGNQLISLENPFIVQNSERPLSQNIAYSGTNPVYIGEASPGMISSEAKWRIKKLLYSGSQVIGTVWANGNAEFDKVWDDRTSYSYS